MLWINRMDDLDSIQTNNIYLYYFLIAKINEKKYT